MTSTRTHKNNKHKRSSMRKRVRGGISLFTKSTANPVFNLNNNFTAMRRSKFINVYIMTYTKDPSSESYTIELNFSALSSKIQCIGTYSTVLNGAIQFADTLLHEQPDSSIKQKVIDAIIKERDAGILIKRTCFSPKNKITIKYDNTKLIELKINETSILNNVEQCGVKLLIDLYLKSLVAKGKLYDETGNNKYILPTLVVVPGSEETETV